MTKFPNQQKEKYYGNREYKLILNCNHNNKNQSAKHKKNKNKNNKNNKYSNIVKYNSKVIDIKKLQKRTTQMLFRINEGKGKAIYIIGIDDNGNNIGVPIQEINESIEYLEIMSREINATINNYRIYNGQKGYILTARVFIEPFKEFEFF